MSAWEALVLRVWREADGVRGRIVDIHGRQIATFSSAREAADIIERWILERTSDDAGRPAGMT